MTALDESLLSMRNAIVAQAGCDPATLVGIVCVADFDRMYAERVPYLGANDGRLVIDGLEILPRGDCPPGRLYVLQRSDVRFR